jgi:hypothetical protein
MTTTPPSFLLAEVLVVVDVVDVVVVVAPGVIEPPEVQAGCSSRKLTAATVNMPRRYQTLLAPTSFDPTCPMGNLRAWKNL